jgi:hypothetical protein
MLLEANLRREKHPSRQITFAESPLFNYMEHVAMQRYCPGHGPDLQQRQT